MVIYKVVYRYKTADTLLEEAILPLSQYFQENNFILKWFFIRYTDPKPHLRIRFHLKNKNTILLF